ncbi:ribosome-associated translation inhibitor RaiA [bacterium]|nr:ribosome-associated translation inhibitor RaiA [bacterium]
MRITITARRFKLPENIKNYAQREVMRLEKYYDGIIDTEMILSWEKFYRMAEIKMRVFGTTLTAQEREDDMRKAIKLAIEKMERQLIKYKDKKHDFDHEKAVVPQVSEEEQTIPIEDEES